MTSGTIPGNLISIVTFQSLLLRGFERLVFGAPTVLEKPLGIWAFRLHRFAHCFAAIPRHGCHPLRHRNVKTEDLKHRGRDSVSFESLQRQPPNAHSSVYQLSMDAFSNLLDHFAVEGGQVIWLATGDKTIVHDDFFIHPATASIAHVRLNRRPRG